MKRVDLVHLGAIAIANTQGEPVEGYHLDDAEAVLKAVTEAGARIVGPDGQDVRI